MQTYNDYPRPQLVRDSYICLNGEWDYAIRKEDTIPTEWDGKILVPYSPEAELSGVNRQVQPDEWLFYKLELNIPSDFIKDKVLLHFGAVDQIAEIFINGYFVGKHVGGYLPFSFDIRPYLQDKNTLIVRVKDYSDTSYYSRGKQKLKRGGIWYTAQSGIWMPVWMESVYDGYVESLRITPDVDNSVVRIKVNTTSKTAMIVMNRKGERFETKDEFVLKIENPILWDIDNPYLYDFEIRTDKDRVKSYFAMRKISQDYDENGHLRFELNDKPVFVKGTLDQGYFKKSLLTPTCDDDYIKDIQMLKDMGYNTIRKHIKIESLRYYYLCDKMGMMVWQDFVNGGEKYKFLNISMPLITKHHVKDNQYRKFSRQNEQGRYEALQEFKDTIRLLYNSPCIYLWTIFNEGWGQFNANRTYRQMNVIDETRLYDHASGWHDQGVSDIKSLHIYWRKLYIPSKKQIKNRIVAITECGGYALPIEGHEFTKKGSFGYTKIKYPEQLYAKYKDFIENQVVPLIKKGLSGFIYTQTSDVEDEVNGLVTYDREVVKIRPSYLKELNDKCKL